jgi:hypothetical protein
MKLTINYDLIRKTLQAKENFGISKVISKHFKKASYWFGISATFNLAIGRRIEEALFSAIITANMILTLDVMEDLSKYKKFGDIDRKKDMHDLDNLANQLENANINTTGKLLLHSKEYETKYKIKLNEKKLPYLLQEKYILVPTYNNYSGDIKETSLLQEHEIGSKTYVLSLGSPSKKFKPAFSRI